MNMMSHFGLTLLFAATITATGVMEVKYNWVYVDYAFASPQQRVSAIKYGQFIKENCVILDVDVFQGITCYNDNIIIQLYSTLNQSV